MGNARNMAKCVVNAVCNIRFFNGPIGLSDDQLMKQSSMALLCVVSSSTRVCIDLYWVWRVVSMCLL